MQSLSVWAFHGQGGRFSSGIFMDKREAIAWIAQHKLTGVLTQYPLNQGVYDWAIENTLFEVTKAHESRAEFIQQFTCAGQQHYHFEHGVLD